MNNSKTSLFLMELIIVIMFFSLCSAVCVQLFFNTHQMDIESDIQTHANLLVQNLSECYSAGDGDLEKVADFFDDAELNSDHSVMTVYYNENWEEIPSSDQEDAGYCAVLSTDTPEDSQQTGGTLLQGKAQVVRINDNTVILDQDLNKYIQYRLN